MPRPIGTAAELERRRRRAVELLEQGESPSLIARILGVHETSVHRWRRQARTAAGLTAQPHPGPKPRLSREQLARLENLLREGAEQHGWPNRLWTASRVTTLIRRHFDIDYHPEHVRRILKERLGWTSQKPQLRAREQDDKEVARSVDDDFRRITRDAYRPKAPPAFLDQPGSMPSTPARRPLAPSGTTAGQPALSPHAPT